jgi:hypothetical protein
MYRTRSCSVAVQFFLGDLADLPEDPQDAVDRK